MDSGFLIVVAVAVVGFSLVGLLGYLSYLSTKKRREAFAARAAERGWTYAVSDNRFVTRFSGTPFGTGDDREATNVVTGRHFGRAFEAFDYEYTTTSTSTDSEGHTTTSTQRHTFAVVAVEVGPGLPALSVEPEGFFGRIVGRLTNHDIELESEQFNRAFTVHCPDRKFATDVLDPRMMEYLLTLPDLAWSFRDGALLTVTARQQSLETLDTTLAAVAGILDRVPAFVWQQLFGGTPPDSASPTP